MAPARQGERNAVDSTERLEDEGRDAVRIAPKDARGARDPLRAGPERRAATAPLVWYIEDTLDLAQSRPRADLDVRTP